MERPPSPRRKQPLFQSRLGAELPRMERPPSPRRKQPLPGVFQTCAVSSRIVPIERARKRLKKRTDGPAGRSRGCNRARGPACSAEDRAAVPLHAPADSPLQVGHRTAACIPCAHRGYRLDYLQGQSAHYSKCLGVASIANNAKCQLRPPSALRTGPPDRPPRDT